MTYIDCLRTQAKSAWATWHAASDRACQATATVWEWYVDAFFSTKADKVYRELGNTLGFAMVCTVALGMSSRIYWEGCCG